MALSCGETARDDAVPESSCEQGPGGAGSSTCLTTTEQLDRAEGKVLFGQWCVPCHGTGGQGDGITASRLDPPPVDLTSSHTRSMGMSGVEEMIGRGAADSGRKGVMPRFGNTLTKHKIRSLATHVLELKPPSSAEVE